MPLIPIHQLHDDPRNANVCSPEILEKLTHSIQQTGFYQPLTVRPQGKHYIIVDGHHRKQALAQLGHKEVRCHVKDMSDEEARLLLLTLNRLRGTDIPRKRAELLESLLPVFPVEELSQLLPESPAEIEGLLALLKQEDEALEAAIRAQIEAERQSLPVPFGFMVPAEDAELVHQALALYHARGKTEQGTALVAICRDVLRDEQA